MPWLDGMGWLVPSIEDHTLHRQRKDGRIDSGYHFLCLKRVSGRHLVSYHNISSEPGRMNYLLLDDVKLHLDFIIVHFLDLVAL